MTVCVQCRSGITANVPPTVYCDSDWPVALSPAKGTRPVESKSGRSPDDGDVAPPEIRLVLAFARCADSRAVPVNTAFERTTRTSASASRRCSDAPGTYAPTVPRLRPSPRLRELLPRRNDSA